MLDFKDNITSNDCLLIIFGATGDLARSKLYPAIYNLYIEGLLPKKFAVVGVGRRIESEIEYKEEICNSIKTFSRKVKHSICEEFLSLFKYKKLDLNDTEKFKEFRTFLNETDKTFGTKGKRIYYLAVAPKFFGIITEQLKKSGIINDCNFSWQRVVFEKPFGYSLDTAIELNNKITNVFGEDNIYRIDHYLGKEMLQNIMVIRFANVFFEPLWNNKYIDNIQIIHSETIGIKNRGRYYENAVALRDMLHNHLMQLLAIIAMEPPVNRSNEMIRNEKVKVLKLIKDTSEGSIKNNVVRGQYDRGTVDGQIVKSYLEEKDVNPLSTTEAFIALKLFIDNARWRGVPFYLRTGKRMPENMIEVAIQFKKLPEAKYFDEEISDNLLIFKIQPQEGVYLRFNAKNPVPNRRLYRLRWVIARIVNIRIIHLKHMRD